MVFTLYKKKVPKQAVICFTTVTSQSLNVHIWPQKIYQLITKCLCTACLDNKNSIKNTKQDTKWVRLCEWTFHVWTALCVSQWKPLLRVTLSTLLPTSFHFSVCQNKGKSEAKANKIKEFQSGGWSYSTFVHRGRQSKAKSSTATSNTDNHAFINICHLYRSVSRIFGLICAAFSPRCV